MLALQRPDMEKKAMLANTMSRSRDYAQVVAELVASLPPERAAQVYDFARFLQSQPVAPHTQHVEEDDWPAAEVAVSRDLISHAADVPILVAAIKIKTGYLVTLNRRHFIEDSEVARRSGLRIGTPGDALAWVRGEIG